MKRHANKKAFTLVELLTVVAIIVLLATILLPSLNAAIRLARTAKVASRMRDIASACEQYKQATGYYPGQLYTQLLTGSSPSGPLTGSQVLGMCLMPAKNPSGYAAWNGTSATEWGDPAQRWAEYLSCDLQDPQTINSSYSNDARPCSVSDGFPTKQMAILYFPARIGPFQGVSQYVEGDNTPYLTGVQWTNMDPAGTGGVGDFNSFIRDYRVPTSATLPNGSPYNDGSNGNCGFLLIGANGKRLYGASDSPRNWSN